MLDKWLAAENRWSARHWLALAASLLLLLLTFASTGCWLGRSSLAETTAPAGSGANQWQVFAADQVSGGGGSAQWQSVGGDEAAEELQERRSRDSSSPKTIGADEQERTRSVLEATDKSFRAAAALEEEEEAEGEAAEEEGRKILPEKHLRSLARRALRIERKPILNEFSFPANLVQGMRFVLMCQVLDGELPVQIKWFKEQQELSNEQLLRQSLLESGGSSAAAAAVAAEQLELLTNDELGSSLLFRKVQPKHSGNYTCLASNRFGSASYSSSMSVKVPPRWRLEPQDQESVMGEQVTVDCQASGNPNPFIRWKFAGAASSGNLSPMARQHPAPQSADEHQPEEGSGGSSSQQQQQLELLLSSGAFKQINSNHQVQTLENGSLSIRSASKEHEGLYLCEADNGIEPALLKVIRLLVHLQAQFSDEIQSLDSIGSSGQLDLAANKQVSNKQLPGSGGGVASTLSSTRNLRVLHNVSQVRLLCQPLGEPPLSVDWLKDGQLIYTHSSTAADLSSSSASSSSSSSLLAGSGSSAAVVAALSSAFSGSLAGGQQAAASFNQPQVQPGQQQPQQQQQLLDLNLSSRYHVSTRRSSVRPNGLDSELLLTGGLRRTDAGLFTCAARNAFGQAERRLRLIVQEPPEPPEVVDVEHIGSRSIGLRWLAPFDGNSPILKYLVEYRRLAGVGSAAELTGEPSDSQQSEKIMAIKTAAATATTSTGPNSGSSLESGSPVSATGSLQVQHTVHELEPLTRYSMRVVAVNGVGRSRASVALSLRTEEEVPSVVPINVEVAILSSKSIKLHWTISYAPEHELIDGFFVGYRSFEASQLIVDGSTSLAAASAAASAAAAKTAATSEQPTFTYKTIRLTNQQQPQLLLANQPNLDSAPGAGEQRGSSSTSEAYLSPVASVTKTVPPQPMSPFASSPGSASQRHHTTNVISTFEYLVSGLERNTEYTILIQCFNKKGAGPTSDPVVFKTYMDDPPDKLALNVEEVSESSVRVSWRFLTMSHIEQIAQSSIGSKPNESLDGYVLTFAKVAPRKSRYDPTNLNKPHLSPSEQLFPISSSSSGSNRSNAISSAARISSTLPQQSSSSSSTNDALEQWQAVQLAPQQRSHQLKNLECGTSYSMRIWAFNKIGKGEPSDLMTISTRGKAPVAPDRRSFIVTNSTQVRLYLSAWYDGGCEIDKFAIQYRLRGQQEWMLVSNNILKEQVSLLIKDLLPATSYELLVSAQNQVGPTEMKYKFTTLDANGKQVASSGLSFLGNTPGLDEEDYDNEDTAVKRDFWPGADHLNSRSLAAMFRHLLNSPFALILSLLLFAVLLFLLLFHRFGGSSSQSEETLSTSNKSSNGIPPRSSCDGNATILDNDGPISLANGSITDSPRLHLQNSSPSRLVHGIPSHLAECHYQTYCSPPNGNRANQAQVPAGYGRTDCSTYAPAYGSHYLRSNQRASVHRSATLDALETGLPVNQQDSANQQQQQQQQQCLMQMLMMGPSQQQQERAPFDSDSNNHSSYATAALTTIARNKGSMQITGAGDPLNYNGSQLFSNPQTATLGRHLSSNVDYQRLQQQEQQQSGYFAGKPQQLHQEVIASAFDGNLNATSNLQSNTSSTVINKQQNSASNRLEEVYPMSTFKQYDPCSQQSLTAPGSSNYFSSNSTTSTSGCETMTSAVIEGADQSVRNVMGTYQQEDSRLPQVVGSSSMKSVVLGCDFVDQARKECNGANNNDISFDSKSCDKSSNYDVPFKSFRNHSSEVESNAQLAVKSQFCY